MTSQFSLTKAVVAGMSATVVMTLFTFMGGLMGIKMNIPEMLGHLFGGSLAIGWIMHFMIGVVLAINYGLIFHSRVNVRPTWLRGAIFGLLPWIMAQVIVMPTISIVDGMSFTSGLFSGSIMMAMASLIGHLVFGVVLGLVYKSERKLSVA